MLNLILLFLALFVSARIFGALAVRLKAPAVVGEILAGMMLTPFRHHLPLDVDAQNLFSFTILAFGVAFLLVAGLELDLSYLRRHLRAAFQVGLAGLAVPALAGAAFVLWSEPSVLVKLRGEAETETWKLAAVVATILSISAIPVIAKTLQDLRLLGTRVGMLTISSALFDDLIGWAVITAAIGSSGSWTSVLLFAVAAGAMVKLASPTIENSLEKPIDFVRRYLAPVYFASLAFRVDVLADFDLELVAVVVAIGATTKFVACGLAARLAGLESREAWSIGAAMNSRGAMGIVFANAARDARVISSELYVAFIMLAIVTSLVSGPIIRHLMGRASVYGKGFGKWQTD